MKISEKIAKLSAYDYNPYTALGNVNPYRKGFDAAKMAAYDEAVWEEERSKIQDAGLQKVYEDRAEMVDSYIQSIVQCGGSSAKFIKEMDRMTVKEMIDILAQNGVRFTTNRK